MPGIRLDRFLTSTAVALVLAAAPIGAGAESLTAPDSTATTTSDSTAGQQATSPDADKAAAKPTQATDQSTADVPTPAASATTSQPAASSAQPETTPPAVVATPAPSPQPATAQTEPETPAPATAAAPTPQPDQSATNPETPSPAAAAASPAAPESTGTTAPAETPAAAATAPAAPAVNETDAAIADQLRDGLASGKFDSLVGGKKDRTLIDAFYSGRAYQPLWITNGKANEHAKSAIDYLGHVDADGLDPADYPVPNFTALTDPAALADAELRLSMTIITYAHHAAVGRVHWSRVSADIEYTDKPPEPADVLANMADTKDIPAALASYEPQTPGYLALKAKLAEIRAGKVDPSKPPVPNGRTPRIGAQDDRVPALRDRLGVPGDGSTTYDKALADAVKKFQEEHQLKATGLLTEPTIEALNGRQPDRPTDIILANMERWRWMPHQFGNTYVIVNLPDYSLRLMHDGKLVWQTRIVVGKPAMPTPLMTGEMKYITINPTWNVPPSIVNHEYLPALAQDPTVLERMGLKVGHNPDGTVHIWQPPGDKNALGRIRFNFPNKFLVYQHDTPDKYMFAYDKRAFSHGCMRVQDPQRYAELLLSLVRPGDDYSIDRIRRMIATGQETDIQFPTFVPVNLTYQTAFVDDQGKLQFRDDIYGRDKELLALLKSNGEERRVADIAVEHKVDITHRQVLAIPDQPSLWGGRSYATGGNSGRDYYPAQSDGGGFFARLFGGGFGSPPVAPRKPVARRRVTRARDTVEQR